MTRPEHRRRSAAAARWRSRWTARPALAAACALLALGVAGTGHAQPSPGDILVADSGADAVFVVDPVTGAQSVLASGAPLADPSGIAVSPRTGLVYVSDRTSGLIEIDPADGSMAVVSSGGDLALPEDVIVSGSNGQIHVVDGLSGVILVDPDTGAQTVGTAQTGSGIMRLPLFGAPRAADMVIVVPGPLEIRRVLSNGSDLLVGKGGGFQLPTGITARGTASSNVVLVTDAGSLATADGQIIEVAITTYSELNPGANQTVIASGGELVDPLDVETDLAAQFLFVVDPAAAAGAGAVIRVDAFTGDQFVLSSGDLFVDPVAIEVHPNIASTRVLPDVYVADASAAEILRVSRASPAVQTLLASGGFLSEPTAIVVERGGAALFVADRGALAPGAIVRIAVSDGSQTLVASGGSLVDPEAMIQLPDGDLLVADSNASGLLRVDSETGAQSTVPGTTGGFTAIVQAPDGDVYAVPTGSVEVVRVDPGGGGTQTVTSGGNLTGPLDLVARDGGPLIALDASTAVVEIDPDAYDSGNPGGNQLVISTGDELVSPTGFGQAPDGTLFVTDPGAAAGAAAVVNVFVPGGSQNILTSADRLVGPSAAASARPVVAPGDILVADANTDRILRIDPVSGDQSVVSTRGLLDFPDGIAFDPLGGLLVACANSNLLVHVDLDTGDQLALAAGPDLPDPRAVTVDAMGRVYVGSRVSPYPIARVDLDTGDTVVIASNNQNEPGGSQGETRFTSLQKLLVDPATGELLVTSNAVGIGVSADFLLTLDPDTIPLPALPSTILAGPPLAQPNEMAIDPDTGQLFVANGRDVLEVDRAMGTASPVTSGGLLDRAAGLAMEADGSLLVTTIFGDAVVRIDRSTGAQELVSYANLLRQPQGIAVVPAPEPGVAALAGSALALLAALRARRRRGGTRGARAVTRGWDDSRAGSPRRRRTG